ncbi:MAG: DUF736 family protein [Pseudomonadota bacterium]
MPTIGYVTRLPNGSYKGRLATLLIRRTIEFVPNDKYSEARGDYRIMSGEVEIGTAWHAAVKSRYDGRISLRLAAPEFGDRALSAELTRLPSTGEEMEYAITWNPSAQ